jgi:uncharacterized CHY-type Zn-finger protein
MIYKFKKPPEKEYGEMKCPYCKKQFFNKTSLSGHIGGAHRRFTTQKTKQVSCKFCNDELVKGKNWPLWAIKQQNLICIKCKRKQNRDSYRKKMKEKGRK